MGKLKVKLTNREDNKSIWKIFEENDSVKSIENFIKSKFNYEPERILDLYFNDRVLENSDNLKILKFYEEARRSGKLAADFGVEIKWQAVRIKVKLVSQTDKNSSEWQIFKKDDKIASIKEYIKDKFHCKSEKAVELYVNDKKIKKNENLTISQLYEEARKSGNLVSGGIVIEWKDADLIRVNVDTIIGREVVEFKTNKPVTLRRVLKKIDFKECENSRDFLINGARFNDSIDDIIIMDGYNIKYAPGLNAYEKNNNLGITAEILATHKKNLAKFDNSIEYRKYWFMYYVISCFENMKEVGISLFEIKKFKNTMGQKTLTNTIKDMSLLALKRARAILPSAEALLFKSRIGPRLSTVDRYISCKIFSESPKVRNI
jgi:hypothetical protein